MLPSPPLHGIPRAESLHCRKRGAQRDLRCWNLLQLLTLGRVRNSPPDFKKGREGEPLHIRGTYGTVVSPHTKTM